MNSERPLLPPEVMAAARRRIEAKVAEAQAATNARGTWTLFRKELDRFLSMAAQSLISPALTTMLWFLVFGFSLGDQLREVSGIRYIDFLVPGLMMMALTNNAFINSGFSFFIAKVHGTVTDLLVTPLTPNQIILAYTCASAVRAIAISLMIWAVASLMGASTIHNLAWIVCFLILTSVAFGILGLLVGILATDFDHVNFIPNFLLVPLTFLGGVFYSVKQLPAPWDQISLVNPIVYMVNGLRFGMTGVSDVSTILGLVITIAFIAIGWTTTWAILKTGKRLRE